MSGRFRDEWLCRNALRRRGDPDNWYYLREFHELCSRYRAETGHAADDPEIRLEYIRLRKDRFKKSVKVVRLPNFPKEENELPKVVGWGRHAEQFLIDLIDACPENFEQLPGTETFLAIHRAFQVRFKVRVHLNALWRYVRNHLGKQKLLKIKSNRTYRGRDCSKPQGFGLRRTPQKMRPGE